MSSLASLAKRFVLWAAVSSQPQVEKVSLENQIELGREHATKHGGQIVAELIVPGESRDIVLFEVAAREIDAYRQLQTLIQQRAFDVFVFLNRSRLGRTAALSMTVVELCERAGIICYDLESPPATLDRRRSTHADLLIGAIKSVGAQNEIIELRRRHETGMAKRIKEGEFPGKVPWGWLVRWETGEGKPRRIIEADPAAQYIWSVIIDLYLRQGMGTLAIAETLQASGHTSPEGHTWHKRTVSWLISRAWLFAGYTELNRDSKTGRAYVQAKSIWPAVISESDAESLTAERTRRRSARRSVTSPLRFSGCVWCVQCERLKIGTNLTIRHANGRAYPHQGYECRPRHAGGHVSERKIKQAILEAIEIVQDEATRQQLHAEAPDRSEPIQSQIALLETQALELRTARNRADDAYTDGIMDTDRYQRQVERLNRQLATLATQIERLQEELRAEAHAGRFGERLIEIAQIGQAMLDTSDLRLANAWFRQHFRIQVNEDLTIDVDYL